MTSKRSVGRPLKFGSVEKLQKQIDGYFKECDTKDIPYTITGLALALDTSRETLINYEKKEEYFDTIKRAKLFVEHGYELRLISRGGSGDIFGLKNFGWTDKQDLNLGGQEDNPIKGDLTVTFVNAPDE